jgi:putative spermidine/putrescine transport system permease protein
MLDRNPTDTQVTHGRRLWLYVLVAAIVIFLIAPSLLVVPLSFSAERYLSFPPSAWSLRWYQAYLGSVEWRDATIVSFSVAVMTTLVSTVLGTLAAYGLHVARGRFAGIAYGIFLLPLIVPGILIAIAIFLIYAQVGFNNTLHGIVLAHSVVAMPLVVITVSSGLKGYDMNQEMAARSLGASRPRAFFTVTLPQIRISVVSGALLAFVTSLDEVVISLFIAGGDTATLTKRMFNALRDELDPTIAAISTILIVLSVALLAVSQLLQRNPDQRS